MSIVGGREDALSIGKVVSLEASQTVSVGITSSALV
jgi:hypothetical protein